jgi:hypothetical protein
MTFIPHAAASLSMALSGQAPHSTSPYQYLPNVMELVAAYVVILVVLVVLGLCMGWQKPGQGGGGGGGGTHKPPEREPTPPGGQQLTQEPPPITALSDDFAAWERQLQGGDRQAPDRNEDAPVGSGRDR